MCFMCHLKEKLTRDGKAPSLYKRYMDDTLARMPAIDADADFLTTSNALRRPEPELQWPKLTTDNKIPFIWNEP